MRASPHTRHRRRPPGISARSPVRHVSRSQRPFSRACAQIVRPGHDARASLVPGRDLPLLTVRTPDSESSRVHHSPRKLIPHPSSACCPPSPSSLTASPPPSAAVLMRWRVIESFRLIAVWVSLVMKCSSSFRFTFCWRAQRCGRFRRTPALGRLGRGRPRVWPTRILLPAGSADLVYAHRWWPLAGDAHNHMRQHEHTDGLPRERHDRRLALGIYVISAHAPPKKSHSKAVSRI